MTINAQSLRNKMNEFKLLVEDKKPQIISITESWGDENTSDGIFALKGYTMYRDDKSGIGGGALLYIKDNIEQRVCRPLNAGNFESSTWCWIIEKNGKKILVGSIYRSPSGTQANNKLLTKLIEKASEIAGDNRLLILGDFNLPNIDWINKELKVGFDTNEEDMFEVISDCFLHQHVTKLTRFRNNQASTLDLIFTKEEEDVKDIEVLQPLGLSDHGVVIANFVSQWRSRVVQKKRRLYHKGNYGLIIEGLNRVNWGAEFENKSVQECWDIFKNKLEELVEKHVPMCEPKDYNEPWMNSGLMRLWKKKYFAWKRFTETRSHANYLAYKNETKKLKKDVRKAKRKYERKLAKQVRHNRRAFYRYVNSKLTVRPELTEIQNENGQLVDKEEEICNILGKYFSSVHTNRWDGELPDMIEQFETEMSNIQITREKVKERLEKLNVNKSCGPDNINPFVLQATADACSIPLKIIFSKSLDLGECPSDWRSANVTPIHKKGSRTDPCNYRPVSLTSQVCKVLESIVREHILKHLNSNNILSNSQHGFRQGRSCLTNLLETLETWTDILNDKNDIDVAYLDFRKAFDLVSHRHLIYKMSKYGIKNNVLKWVTSFLDQRTQRVVIRGTASQPFNVTSGVPQGSVLGPILFLIFINDLPLEVISHTSLFADDSKLFTRIVSEKNRALDNHNGHEALQRDLDAVREWAGRWKMEFNVDKCKIMHLGKTNPKHTYTMGGTSLTVTTAEKDLGVLIDDKLNFRSHIKEIVSKANRVLGLIRIGFDCLDKEMFMNLYPVLVRPHLEYCVQVWSPHLVREIKLVEGVQRRATKLVPELKELPYEERLKRLGLTTLEERRVRGDMIETYKIMTGKENVDRDKFFQIIPTRGDPQLRHNMKLYKKSFFCSERQHFFSQRVIDNWNGRGKAVVESDKTGTFKKRLDKEDKERRAIRENQLYV